MDSGFYATFTGLSTRMDELELIANNLANTSTTGFKAHLSFYRSLPAWLQPSLSNSLNSVVNQFGVLGGERIDLAPGNLQTTGNPTDVALQGDGFFTVQTGNGLRYTRDGNFRLNTQRQLVTAQGDPILGDQGAIQIPDGPVTISQDGTLSVNGAVVSKLKITGFASPQQLKAEGSTYFAADAGAGKVLSDAQVIQGSLESSNSNPIRATISLMELQRTAQIMEKALYIFHNEFNRSAAQDIGRV
jgi:flagellar basal-body rod protein FlgF/flagellar basal-body rod protein FlgG